MDWNFFKTVLTVFFNCYILKSLIFRIFFCGLLEIFCTNIHFSRIFCGFLESIWRIWIFYGFFIFQKAYCLIVYLWIVAKFVKTQLLIFFSWIFKISIYCYGIVVEKWGLLDFLRIHIFQIYKYVPKTLLLFFFFWTLTIMPNRNIFGPSVNLGRPSICLAVAHDNSQSEYSI